MKIERFEDDDLAQYSYAVVCEGAGTAAIVDPRRDVDVYLEWARRERVRIEHVLETHVHADFASGARELAERCDATLHLSAYDHGEEFEVAFPHRELHDRERLEMGNVVIEARHTPGHTPEHLAFLVFDRSRSRDVPIAMLSGDFLFVGSLGRPDLLGEDATRRLAGELFRSVRERIADLPDGLEIHPGHGAGSMCGAGLGGRPISTLGFERVANRYLDPGLDEEAFVGRLLASAPPFPPYYRRMKRLNADGPPRLDGVPGLAPIPPERFHEKVAAGALVIDLRDPISFAGGHVPGSLAIGVTDALSTWAGWLVPPGRTLLLVGHDAEAVESGARRLVRVGLDRIGGHLDGGFDAWTAEGYDVADLPQLDPHGLAARLDAADAPVVIDVRTDEEWARGHIAGARHLMGGWVPDRLGDIPTDRPLALVCGGGYRSTAVGSFLEAAGFRDVTNLSGGMRAWERAGMPTVRS